jgi:hypothetical protein
MEQVHYMRIVPNSHSFGSLSNIVMHNTLKSEELTKEYLLIGFRNTLKRDYEIKKIDKTKPDEAVIFKSIDDIINFIENYDNYFLNMFVSIIKSTIASGYDLKPKYKMERKEVYNRIDTERQYQDLRWSPRREKNGTPDEEKPISEWVNYLEWHLSKAKEKIYFLEDKEALAEVRKVAALAVRCLEIHSCPEREIPEDLLILNQE